MNDNIVIDTNILVYAFDLSEEEKRSRCKPLIEKIFKGESVGIVTNQILSEFFVTVTKKIQKPLSIEQAEIIVRAIENSKNWVKISYNEKTVLKAIDIMKKTKIPFWDGLIVATMIENNIFLICSEDQDFKKMHGIKMINIFKKA